MDQNKECVSKEKNGSLRGEILKKEYIFGLVST
jgi:hypothetical protein